MPDVHSSLNAGSAPNVGPVTTQLVDLRNRVALEAAIRHRHILAVQPYNLEKRLKMPDYAGGSVPSRSPWFSFGLYRHQWSYC